MTGRRVWPTATPFLYVVTERISSTRSHATVVAELVASEVAVIQVRDKHLTDSAYCREAGAAVLAASSSSSLIFVNDRPDIAVLSGAHGVHVGTEDLAVEDARRMVGETCLIGVSSHGLEEALRAADTSADYVALGPIFPSSTKSGRRAVGVEMIARLRERTGKPIVAIGGISGERIAEVIAAGATGVAVVSAVMRSANVGDAARELASAVLRAASA